MTSLKMEAHQRLQDNIRISREGTLPSNTRNLYDTYLRVQDPPAYVLSSLMNGEASSPPSSPHEQPRQSFQGNSGFMLDQEVSKADDSGVSEKYLRKWCSSRVVLYSIFLMSVQRGLVHLKLAYATLASQLHPAAESVLPSVHVPRL